MTDCESEKDLLGLSILLGKTVRKALRKNFNGNNNNINTMTTASLKAAKEAFVTGHDGSTPWEVLLVCMAVVSGSALYDQAATAW